MTKFKMCHFGKAHANSSRQNGRLASLCLSTCFTVFSLSTISSLKLVIEKERIERDDG